MVPDPYEFDLSNPDRSDAVNEADASDEADTLTQSARGRLDLFDGWVPNSSGTKTKRSASEFRRKHMPLWTMEQIAPYFEKEGNRIRYNPTDVKLVKDHMTNSEVGIITLLEVGESHSIIKDGEYREEKINARTIIAHTVSKLDVYREKNPDSNSYEKAAKALYKIYWKNLPCWGRFHRIFYKWSLPTIAGL